MVSFIMNPQTFQVVFCHTSCRDLKSHKAGLSARQEGSERTATRYFKSLHFSLKDGGCWGPYITGEVVLSSTHPN